MIEEELKKLASQLLDGQKRTIGIYGNGATGKSSFTRQLIEFMGEEKVTLLETDAYVIKGEYRRQVVPKENPEQMLTACLPISHELASLERDIRALQAGLPILTIETSWAPSQVIQHDKAILVVEGMSAAFLPKDLFDLSICLRASSDVELQRRLTRDVQTRGRNPEFVRQAHISRRSQYERYYRFYEQESDRILDNE